MAKRKYNLSRRLTYALALEAAAEDIIGGLSNSDIPFGFADGEGGNDADAGRIRGFQRQIAEELQARAKKILVRLA